MTFVLLALCIVAAAVAHRRQARRIDALEQRIAALTGPRVFTPAVGSGSVPDTNPARGPVPPPSPKPPPAKPPPASATFEQLVGGRLPIWVGGAALAIAGYFLVRLAIESGLLTPAVRVLLATLFGFALLAAGEGAARLRWIAGDPRVTQALSGAGIATLYAAIYLAGSRYALIGPVPSFVLLAAITLAALALSLRRGAPVALMALVGGFATPLLAGSHDQAVLPLLAYLGLLSAGLFTLSIARGWLWLALTAAAGSLVWSGLLIATGAPDDALAAGAFAILLAVAATPTVGASGGTRAIGLLRALPLVVGAAELVALVAMTRFGAAAWQLYLLLSAATIALAWRDPRLLPAVAAVLALSAVALAGGIYDAPVAPIVLAVRGIALLFGGAGHVLARRRGGGWAAIGALGLAIPYAILWHERPDLMMWLLFRDWSALDVAMLFALPPLWLAWCSRRAARATPPFDLTLQVAAGTAAGFLAHALWIFLSARIHPALSLVPLCILIGGAGLAQAQRRLGDGGVGQVAIAAAALAVLAMLMAAAPLLAALIATLAGEWQVRPPLPGVPQALLGALLPAALIALIVWRADAARTRLGRLLLAIAGVAAAIGAYLLWKQLFALRSLADFVADGFLERLLLTQAIFAAGWAASSRGWLRIARALTLVAALRMLWLDLVVFNPAFVAQAVGSWPIANLVTLHFLAGAVWIERAWHAEPPGRGRTLALAALVAVAAGGALLVVRQAFHGSLLVAGPVGRAEFYGYSAAGVLLAVALFARGAALHDRPLRIAGLGLLTLMVLKVFLVDAAALEGLLRIASFLGLGVTLIAIGWAYGRLLGRTTAGTAAG